MKKRHKMILLVLSVLFGTAQAFAADYITLPFSTTFSGCPEESLVSAGTITPCEGWFPQIYQTYGATPNGNYTQITTAANFANGGGGRGWRWWNPPSYYQRNYNSPGIRLFFTDGSSGASQNQFWLRFYIRFQSGYSFSGGGRLGGMKMPYLSNVPGAPLAFLGMGMSQLEYSNGGFVFYSDQLIGWNNYWNSTGVNTVSDGQWMCVEQYYKASSTSSSSDGAVTVWINGDQLMEPTTVPLGKTVIGGFAIPENGTVTSQSGTTNDLWSDIDDVAVSITGRIGCPYTISGGLAVTVVNAGTAGSIGTTTSSPSGVSCQPTCAANFTNPTSITLTATPGTGSSVTGFTGGCTAAATTCTFTFTASTSVTATYADTQAPSTPGTITFSGVSSTQIGLDWPDSTDNVAVDHYVVDRCSGVACSSFTQIATPSASAYNDTGLSASTSYTYKVSAVDVAGNTSSFSNSATQVTGAPTNSRSPVARTPVARTPTTRTPR